ncbi:DUF2381 family protein [Vitiosangium sp. GDMCC 1.1324]|uniref:DUF2381 family protein n=1 Tax=Vitiosangium sp. (strain GDMCC 1.1324) TaxID=2138576 RepID=UPI000D3AE801|nr:DUF2381 family protein [Vitiosangium sp. GDMCC 1.1324]PTL77021.1 hypothetical protein DAT35_46085 [Vitiosangium sp. GDMCC 1.1324]
MHPRTWPVALWVFLVTLLAVSEARANGRRMRQGTVLVAGQPGGAPSVLYVAGRLSTLVDFEDLLEPRALLTPELHARVTVVVVGPRSLVIVPASDLAEGERLLLPVAGRTEAGGLRTLTLALVTRRDEVDVQARVSFASREPPRVANEEDGGEGAVARMLLESHEPGTPPRLALVTPKETLASRNSDDVRANVNSVLRMDQFLFVSVSVRTTQVNSKPWRLARARMESGCEALPTGGGLPLPVVVTAAVAIGPWQFHTFSTLIPDGVGCVSLTLEEDGPRMLRFERVRLPR